LLQFSEVSLIAWAGRPLYRQTAEELAFGELEIAVESAGKNSLFRIAQYGQIVRALAGAGLDGVICSCKPSQPPCKHAVAAVLYHRAQHGKPLPVSPQKGLDAKAGTPRTRAEVLASTQHTLAEMISLGLARLSNTTEGRLTTLALSAHGVDLPNLVKHLRRLATQVSLQNSRDVTASTPLLLHLASRVHALAFALGQPGGASNQALVGEHKKKYYELGAVELVGVGAEQWKVPSGYAGVALFFWDVTSRRWTRWTDARPTIHANVTFYPWYRYAYEDIWISASTPARMSRSQLRLTKAESNRIRNLSNSKTTQATILGPANVRALHMEAVTFDDWATLAERMAATRASGLSESAPLESLVIVTPAAWEEATYDQMTQTLIRPVLDAAGRVLPLVLPYNAEWPFAVDTLQTWNPEQWETWGILGNAAITSNGLEVRPISLLNRKTLPKPLNSSVLHLTLESLQTISRATAAPAANEAAPAAAEADDPEAGMGDEDAAGDEAIGTSGHSAVSQLLKTACAELEQLAERGARASAPAQESRLRAQAGQLRQIGVVACAAALDGVARRLEAGRHKMTPETEQTALALLRAYYVLRLALEQTAVTEALALYGL
jgi:hypothetical protein